MSKRFQQAFEAVPYQRSLVIVHGQFNSEGNLSHCLAPRGLYSSLASSENVRRLARYIPRVCVLLRSRTSRVDSLEDAQLAWALSHVQPLSLRFEPFDTIGRAPLSDVFAQTQKLVGTAISPDRLEEVDCSIVRLRPVEPLHAIVSRASRTLRTLYLPRPVIARFPPLPTLDRLITLNGVVAGPGTTPETDIGLAVLKQAPQLQELEAQLRTSQEFGPGQFTELCSHVLDSLRKLAVTWVVPESQDASLPTPAQTLAGFAGLRDLSLTGPQESISIDMLPPSIERLSLCTISGSAEEVAKEVVERLRDSLWQRNLRALRLWFPESTGSPTDDQEAQLARLCARRGIMLYRMR